MYTTIYRIFHFLNCLLVGTVIFIPYIQAISFDHHTSSSYHTRMTSSIISHYPYHESKWSLKKGLLHTHLYLNTDRQHTYFGPALLWGEANFRVSGYNDLSSSVGYGMHVRNVNNNTTLAAYGYYAVNHLLDILKEKYLVLDHHMIGGIEITSPTTTVNFNTHVTPSIFAYSSGKYSQFFQAQRKYPSPSHTVGGINLQISRYLSNKCSIVWATYMRQVLCRAFSVIKSSDGEFDMRYSLASKAKKGIELKLTYIFTPQWSMQLGYAYDNLIGSRPSASIKWHLKNSSAAGVRQSQPLLWESVEYRIGPPLDRDISRDKSVSKEKLRDYIKGAFDEDEQALERQFLSLTAKRRAALDEQSTSYNATVKDKITAINQYLIPGQTARVWFLLDSQQRLALWEQYKVSCKVPVELRSAFCSHELINTALKDTYANDLESIIVSTQSEDPVRQAPYCATGWLLAGLQAQATNMSSERILLEDHIALLFQYFASLNTKQQALSFLAKKRITYGLTEINLY